jgi:hypothetical protein
MFRGEGENGKAPLSHTLIECTTSERAGSSALEDILRSGQCPLVEEFLELCGRDALNPNIAYSTMV